MGTPTKRPSTTTTTTTEIPTTKSSSVWRKCIHGDTPKAAILEATKIGDLDIVKLLVENGANVQIKDCSGSTGLHYAAFFAHLDLVKFFVEHGVKIDQHNGENQSALHSAYLGRRFQIAESAKYEEIIEYLEESCAGGKPPQGFFDHVLFKCV